MIRRCRPVDRAIALQLCRAAQHAHNGGFFPQLLAADDAELGSRLHLPLRHIQRLRRGGSPLWHCEGADVRLFFHGETAAADERAVTPRDYGKRVARHESYALRRREQTERRRRLLLPQPHPYPAPGDEGLMAADEGDS